MRHFSVFTFLYLAAAVCLTVVILEHSDITPNQKTSLLVNNGLLYLASILSTFQFWHQGILRSEARLRDKSAWERNLVMFLPMLLIVVTLVTALPNLLNHNWSMDEIARASVGPLLILLSVEQLLRRSQFRRES